MLKHPSHGHGGRSEKREADNGNEHECPDRMPRHAGADSGGEAAGLEHRRVVATPSQPGTGAPRWVSMSGL